MILWSGQGPGIYLRSGWGFGGDVGVAGEVGTSTNLNAFSGESKGFSVAVQGGFSYSQNSAGKTVSGSIGPRVDPKSPCPIVTMRVEQSYAVKFTFTDLRKVVRELRSEANEFMRQAVQTMNAASGIPR